MAFITCLQDQKTELFPIKIGILVANTLQNPPHMKGMEGRGGGGGGNTL